MSALKAWLCEAFPPRPTFHVRDIPDLTGKVIIVTGASTGIGKETARDLLAHGARVYVAVRNRTQAEGTIRELKEETGNEAVFLNLDLANLKAVKGAAEEFLRKETRLHVLFNSAGVMYPPVERLTADGYDLQFGTNVLGHHYFTKLLLPTMIETAKTTSDGKARIVTTSSSGHLLGHLDFETFNDSPRRRKRDTNALYCQSKLGSVVMALELARRYCDRGIVSASLNPGNVKTDLQRHIPRFVQTIISHTILYDVSLGALTQLYAGTMPETAAFNGKDSEVGKKLWDWLEEQVKDV